MDIYSQRKVKYWEVGLDVFMPQNYHICSGFIQRDHIQIGDPKNQMKSQIIFKNHGPSFQK